MSLVGGVILLASALLFYTRMHSVAAKLTDREIDRLATYYSTTQTR